MRIIVIRDLKGLVRRVSPANFQKGTFLFKNGNICTIGKFVFPHTGHFHLFQLLQLISDSKKVSSIVIKVILEDYQEWIPFAARKKKYWIDERSWLWGREFWNSGCDLGVVILLDYFSRTVSAWEFIYFLKYFLSVKRIVCSSDFKFGFQRKGNTKMLKDFFRLHIHNKVKDSGVILSGSLLEKAIGLTKTEYEKLVSIYLSNILPLELCFLIFLRLSYNENQEKVILVPRAPGLKTPAVFFLKNFKGIISSLEATKKSRVIGVRFVYNSGRLLQGVRLFYFANGPKISEDELWYNSSVLSIFSW